MAPLVVDTAAGEGGQRGDDKDPQVKGQRHALQIVPEKARLDRDYLERMSLAFDLRILVVTALAAFTGRGVNH